MTTIERPAADRPGPRGVLRDVGPVQLATGFVAFLFSATGPLAIILSVGTHGGMTSAELSSFVFGVFFVNGLITLGMSWAYRQPLALFWTIPGTVLMGPALQHLSLPEVVGAFYATSLLVLALGLSGLAKRVLEILPMPIVMAMVAGIFLQFGTGLVRAVHADVALAGSMVATFFALSAMPAAARRMPPLIGALIVGFAVVALTGRLDAGGVRGLTLASPLLVRPEFSLTAMAELVVPLAITILLVQHGQGFSVLRQAGHQPPLTAVTVAAGMGGLASAAVGAVGTALTGPTNALITSAGPRDRHYATAMVTACFAILFGLAAPTFVDLLLAMPVELMLTLGGLAILRVLLAAMSAAFRGPFSLGALVCFLVTVADLSLLNVGAAFWGLVAGVCASWLVERDAFHTEDA